MTFEMEKMKLVRAVGFEPTTFQFQAGNSTRLSYALSGTPPRTRTANSQNLNLLPLPIGPAVQCLACREFLHAGYDT